MTRPRSDAARNRALVLRVARDQWAAGDESLQFNAIAKLAGVGVGTVYRHFPTRHALLEALAAERLHDLVAEARAAASAEDAVAGVRDLMRYIVGRALADPGFAAVLEAPDDADPETSVLKAELGAAVAALLARARIRSDVAADDMVHLVCGIAHAIGAAPGRSDLYLDVLIKGLA
ncbi:TetR/AcrR family transcriptional regulator [Herbidospora mongoliensis]|uniref:TetR/AcrR family transcriptional regulator n=1 Tax=Herbidospora mongoliensis TaxID=688067 RepID=UPI00082A7B60|nr:helix-turn-helix domain-containing protein [Herbidospora mongoliensis]